MPKLSCCPLVVWVFLQLIYFCTNWMDDVMLFKQDECYSKNYEPMIPTYFTQNLKCKQFQYLNSNNWKSFSPTFKSTESEQLFTWLTNNVSRLKNERLFIVSNRRYRNVSSGMREFDKCKIAFSFQRFRQYTVDLNNITMECSLKFIDMLKCGCLLLERVPEKESMTAIILKILQPLCIIDDHCYSWTSGFTYENSSNTQGIGNILCLIFNFAYRIKYSERYSNSSTLKDFHLDGLGENVSKALRATNSCINRVRNCNYSKSNFERNNSNLKEIPEKSNDDFFTQKSNSRKNRFLLSLKSDLDENEEGNDASQKARYSRNEKVRSINNQREAANGNVHATGIEGRRKRKSRRLSRDLSSAAARAKRTIAVSSEDEKADARISFSTDNEADYRREIERQIEADFVKIKDSLRLEKEAAIASETFRWPLSVAKNNRQSLAQPEAIDTRQPEIIKATGVCVAAHCQQVIRQSSTAKSRDFDELPTNSRGNVTSQPKGLARPVERQNFVDEKIRQPSNDERKLIGEALIIMNKNASPFSVVRKSHDTGVNLKYSVESISLGLDELLRMGKKVMKKELDNSAQNEKKRNALSSCRNCEKYGKGNNENYRGLDDDEGTKLEEELKELPSMHIQREQGFAGSGKNEMGFAAGDGNILSKDENARQNNSYSLGHFRHAKRRCRRKRKPSFRSNSTDEIRRVKPNKNLYRKRMKSEVQDFNNDNPLGHILANDERKRSPRTKKNDPYKEYKESDLREKLFSKVTEHSRSQMKTSEEMALPSHREEVIAQKMKIPENSCMQMCKKSKRSTASAITRPASSSKFQAKKKNKHSPSLSGRKLKITEASKPIHEASPVNKKHKLPENMNTVYYYDNDNLEAPKVLHDQTAKNREVKASGLGRKLLSLNSVEYDEGSLISANEESNCDYVEKLYEDQRYEEGPSQLHHFQINLRNVTLPANANMEGEDLGIELTQHHIHKSIKSISGNHKAASRSVYNKRTLKSVAQDENANETVKKHSAVKNLFLEGDLIGYDHDPEKNDNSKSFKREIDENVDPDLARLFSAGQEYEINVKGKLHLRLKDSESEVTSEKSSKKKCSCESKISKPRKKYALTERKFAVADKRSKENPSRADDSNLKSKTSNKTRNPLKKISDFFKRKFDEGTNKRKKFRKKIRAQAKVVRIKPEQDEGGSQSTFSPFDQSSTTLESRRRDDCKCAHETTTESELTSLAVDTFDANDITQSTESSESITENNDSNCDSCQCAERSTEMSSTQQFMTNQPETDYPGTKAQLPHAIVSGECRTEPITATTSIISTTEQSEKATIISSDIASSDNSPEEKAKVNNAVEILNFIKNLEKLLKNQKLPLRIGNENGGVEIKLDKIYIRPGKDESSVEMKDISENDQKSDTSEEASQTRKKSKKNDKSIVQTYFGDSATMSLQTDKNARDNKSLPANQWIDEQKIAPNDQSSSRGRKRKKWRRKKRRNRLRKRTTNETGITSKKGQPSYRLRRQPRRRRRRRRRLSST